MEDEQEPDDEYESGFSSKFRDEAKRKKFLNNVLIALGFQLTVCASFIVVSKEVPALGKDLFMSPGGQALSWLAMILWFILLIAISCCRVGRGKPNPSNLALLVISTFLLGVFTASMTVRYDLFSILFAGATTAGVVFILVAITMFTKIDVTDKIMYILGGFLALMLFSFIASLSFYMGWFTWTAAHRTQTIISAFVAVLYVVLILMQLQLIVGGRKYQYDEDDWLVASIMLFYDILMLFMTLLGLSNRNN